MYYLVTCVAQCFIFSTFPKYNQLTITLHLPRHQPTLHRPHRYHPCPAAWFSGTYPVTQVDRSWTLFTANLGGF